jgi:ABC-2 type transport system permease protein
MATNSASIRNDVSDTWLSVQFEMLKHLKRRRLIIVAALAIVVPLLFYIYFYKVHPTAASDFANTSLSFVNLLILISAAMFAGDAVCGEFEKKTSLLLFSTPQKRSTIFAGKYIAAVAATFFVVLLYYLVTTLQIGHLFGWGNMPVELWKSFVAALVYSAAAVSVVFFISSLLKRAVSSIMLGVALLLIVLPVISGITRLLNHEPWFIVTYSAGLITDVFGIVSSGGFERRAEQFHPAFGTGIEVMIVYAVVCLGAAMLLALRKED